MDNQFLYMYMALCLLQVLVFSMCVASCFETKLGSKRLTILLSIIIEWIPVMLCEIVGILLPHFSDILTAVKPLLSVVVYGTATILLYKGSIFKKLLFVFLSLVIDIICDCMISYILFVFIADYAVVANEHSFYRVIGTALFLVLNIPIKYMFAYLWNKHINKKSIGKMGILLLIPISQLITMENTEFLIYYPQITEGISLAILAFSFGCCCVADVIFMHFINKTEKSYRLNAELREKEYMYAVEDEHYKSIEERRYEMAKIRHDLSNQINTAYALIESNSAEAMQLLGEVRGMLDDTKEYEYCGCSVINAAVNNKKRLCEANGIMLDVNVEISSADGISKSDLCSLFTNLLDNAINENLCIDDRARRKITLRAAKSKSYVVISVTNPIADAKRVKPKDNDGLHGYGLRIVEDISRRYDGRFTREASDGVYSATVSVCENSAVNERISAR